MQAIHRAPIVYYAATGMQELYTRVHRSGKTFKYQPKVLRKQKTYQSLASLIQVVQLTPPMITPSTIAQKIFCERPFRKEGFNISCTVNAHTTRVDCYGHGGSGLTTVFGSVERAIELYEKTGPLKATPIRVIGSGCMGLTMGIELHRRGYTVAGITTKGLYDMPSWKAGGTFGFYPSDAVQVDIGRNTFRTYQQIENKSHPYLTQACVRKLPIYSSHDSKSGVEDLEESGVIPPKEPVTLDFGNGVQHPHFYRYWTYFIDTTELMRQLMREVERLRIPSEIKEVLSFDQIQELTIFNCTGLGAKKLNHDDKMVAVRGHLVALNEASGSEHMNYIIGAKVQQDGKDEMIYMVPKKDVGGTNTDAVLIQAGKFIKGHKVPTQTPIERGVMQAIQHLLPYVKGEIQQIHIGTTHATNALLQESSELLKVGLIRIAGHIPDLPAATQWPDSLRNRVLVGCETIPGGYTCDAKPITPFSEKAAKEAVARLLDKGAEAIAVVGCFSTLQNDQEKCVAALISRVPVTLSSSVGGVGFLERENAALLNASLHGVIAKAFGALEQSIRMMGIQAPLYMVNNDGSIMDMSHAMQFPILTISAGQTNSFIGAVSLLGYEEAVILDIGGTSTDIGIVSKGLPKRSTRASSIGGVKLHFSIPDVASLPIGGGTIIQDGALTSLSVAKDLFLRSKAFQGDTLTLTDLAIQCGILHIEGADPKAISLTNQEAEGILAAVSEKLKRALLPLVGKNEKIPLLAVGGAAPILQYLLPEIVRPLHADVANAYGAALAKVSASLDIITSLEKRKECLEQLQEAVKEEAIQKGAHKESVRITSMTILPIPYAKDMHRVMMTASGQKDFG